MYKVNYKSQTSMDAGIFCCPFMPDGTDLRPIWRMERKTEAQQRGWCMKLFDEMNGTISS